MTEIKPTHLELCFHIHGAENLYLYVPTIWDDLRDTWLGFIKTPNSNHLIHAEGKSLVELEKNIVCEMYKIFSDDDDTALATEVYHMFKPKSEWPS